MKKTLLSMAFAFAALATGGLNAAEVTDVLTADGLGLGSGYSNFSSKSFTSEAVYAGNAMKGEKENLGAIQLRSKSSNSGIVTTASGGTLKKITLSWTEGTSDARIVDVYGSNEPYNQATDLYSNSTRGELIGSLQKGETELVVEGDYQYFGLRSHDGALYLPEIQVTWETGGEVLDEE